MTSRDIVKNKLIIEGSILENYFDVTLENGQQVTLSGSTAESACESAGINWDEVASFEDSSEIAYKKNN